MSTEFDPNNRLEDVGKKGDAVLKDYNTGMENAISSNEATMNKALDQIGMDEKGNVTEGSAIDKQIDVLNQNTDFAIDTINQQKEQAEKDFTKEQAGAYADYQKQIDPYGAQAEMVAAQGLSNSGYAESLKTQAYVAYQNRAAVNREAYQRVVQDFENQITQARLQNNSALAEIYAKAMAQRLEIITQFGVKATDLYVQMVQGGASIKQQNLSNYLSVYNQLMQEKQHNETLAEQKRQHEAEMAYKNMVFEYQKEQDAKKSVTISGGGGGGSGRRSTGSTSQKKEDTAKIDAAITGKKTPAKSESKNEPTVDMDSLVKAGLAGRSPEYIDGLIRQGVLEEYVEGGKIKYRKVINRNVTPSKNAPKGQSSLPTSLYFRNKDISYRNRNK